VTTNIRPPADRMITCSLTVLVYLCERMREDEVMQYLALTGRSEYDPHRAAAEFYGAGEIKWAVCDKDFRPICAGGYEPLTPGVYQSWMVGTQKGWDEDWQVIHRATRYGIQQLMDHGVRRLQTNGLSSRTAALAWYEKLGMKFEGTMKHFGQKGEDVAMYAITQKPKTADEETL